MTAAWNDNNSTNPNVIIDKNEIVESFKKHAFSSELKEESVGDQVAEIIFRKLVEQSGLVSNQQTTQDQTVALPPEKSSIKKQKYIS